MLEFNVAFFGKHSCPFLERACARFDGIAGDFETGSGQEPFAGAFPVIASSHMNLGTIFSMGKGRFA
jgi:hypothetical protein